MKKLRKSNPNLVSLIKFLREEGYKNNVSLWVDVAERLSKPTRYTAEVNISQINRYTTDGDIIVVPGKVLGAGILDHAVTVSAFAFSRKAREKISDSGRALSILDLLQENPTGKGIKIME